MRRNLGCEETLCYACNFSYNIAFFYFFLQYSRNKVIIQHCLWIKKTDSNTKFFSNLFSNPFSMYL